ncbi:GIY-YIG nuclease family protein [Erythrobacter sp. sf7]|uniref:GIY-YIG nuclease family protein n=1 Tax=Erythrobacter fulvus TaxID=2987523 RepID=A0ABT5JRH0_9SPHN|nr:GIY-YIG nuclease family protein [Erythrobacter fulvus]MDC8755363.1 GIY-YIG nuclease family protein [Erythrobacter fulvus]
MSDLNLDDLADELADFAPGKKKQTTYTAREERIIAGFEDIVRFYAEHGRAPQHGEDRDIFERLYAVRLDRLRAQEDCRALLSDMDRHGLLTEPDVSSFVEADPDLDELASELADLGGEGDITQLRHVRSVEEKRAAEEIARRDKCNDFEKFKPLFEQVKQELASGARVTRPFELKAEIRPGAFFIVGGLITYVAEMDDIFTNAQGRTDARLRVIFDNGTESGMLMRSLQRQLHDDNAGRRITDPAPGPLFADRPENGEAETGTIYVLRSQSDHPFVAEHREVVHKIGVTGGSVETRISGAEKSSTYLLAGVDVVATYKVYGVNCQKLESLLHKVFAAAQLNLMIPDRFGHMVKPREWFLVPLHIIQEAVERVQDRTIIEYRYDASSASMVKR